MYKKQYCNIKGCSNTIYKNYMCLEHYNFYLPDKHSQKISNDVLAVYDGKGNIRQRLLALFDNLLHHAWDIPRIRYEHFPLEHIYLMALKDSDKMDIERVRKVIKDFDVPENENISIMKRVASNLYVEDSPVLSLHEYIFSSKELMSIIPVVISVIGVFASYFILKSQTLCFDAFLGMNISETLKYYRDITPFVILLLLATLHGCMIPRHYNYIAKRAYDLNLFACVRDNLDVLTQIRYVKERNQRAQTYYYSIYGFMAALSIMALWKYFNMSHFCWMSLLLVLFNIVAIIPLYYSYSISVLYFPVFEALKRKTPKIDLYNPDHMGGLEVYHRFLLNTFIYNELIIVIIISLYSFVDSWLLYIIFAFILIARGNHAGWSIYMYISSVVAFKREKRKEINELLVSTNPDAFIKIEQLDSVYYSLLFRRICKFSIIVLLPYLINKADNIFYWLLECFPKFIEVLRF